MPENKRLTREEIPDVRENQKIEIETNEDEYVGTVREITDLGDSTSLKIDIEDVSDIRSMYAHAAYVELLFADRTEFVDNIDLKDN